MNAGFERLTKSWTFYHLVFWISMLLSYIADVSAYFMHDPAAFILSILIRLFLLACLIYGNLLFLIPMLYDKGSRFLYWAALAVLIALFSFFYRALYLRTTGSGFSIPDNGRYFLNILLAVRFLFISYMFLFVKGWFDQEKKMNQMKIAQLDTELKYLRSQVNPHFLFNTLNNIYGLALKKSDQAPEVVMRLSDMMDYMLADNGQEKVLLQKDIQNLENYIELEKIRQGNQAEIGFSVRGDAAGKKIIPLLLLPLLENGFKHGINHKPLNAYLQADLEIRSSSIIFTVINNFSADHLSSHGNHGIGIENLKKRLALQYPGAHMLRILRDNEKFSVYLTIILS